MSRLNNRSKKSRKPSAPYASFFILVHFFEIWSESNDLLCYELFESSPIVGLLLLLNSGTLRLFEAFDDDFISYP